MSQLQLKRCGCVSGRVLCQVFVNLLGADRDLPANLTIDQLSDDQLFSQIRLVVLKGNAGIRDRCTQLRKAQAVLLSDGHQCIGKLLVSDHDRKPRGHAKQECIDN